VNDSIDFVISSGKYKKKTCVKKKMGKNGINFLGKIKKVRRRLPSNSEGAAGLFVVLCITIIL
jgi:hypothetical protein